MSLAKVQQAQSRLQAASRRQVAARHNLRCAVHDARKSHTLAEIGKALGMTRQGVYDLLKR